VANVATACETLSADDGAIAEASRMQGGKHCKPGLEARSVRLIGVSVNAALTRRFNPACCATRPGFDLHQRGVANTCVQ
jgi:hypothetical protein